LVYCVKLLASLRNENNQKVHDQLNEIKRLKDEFMLKKKTLSRTEKKLSEIKAKHQNIVEPLKQAKIQVEELCVTMKEMKCEKRIFNQRKQKLRDAEDKLKNAQWRHEVLFQRFELLHEEREKLRSEFEKSTLELKQGNNLNSILAEKSKSDLYTKLKKECSVLLENNDGADQEKSILIGIQSMVEGMNAIPTKSEGGFPSLLTRSKNELVGTVPT
jgi:chromosome segregation ATPase